MEFKDKLIRIRADLNLTQSGLIKILHVSYPTISRWEMGKVVPNRKAIAVFEKFCKENIICFEEGAE